MRLKAWLEKFWAWYERHYTLNLAFAFGLFVLQFIHLYWLTFNVVAQRLLGDAYFELTFFWEALVVLVDYAEIPALLGVSLIYVNELRKGWNWRSALFLVLLNSQWLHLFWITDEKVVVIFSGGPEETILPAWLAWVAILIDYLEIPVMIDTFFKLMAAIFTGRKINLEKDQ